LTHRMGFCTRTTRVTSKDEKGTAWFCVLFCNVHMRKKERKENNQTL
jgi:hypothetical protein